MRIEYVQLNTTLPIFFVSIALSAARVASLTCRVSVCRLPLIAPAVCGGLNLAADDVLATHVSALSTSASAPVSWL